MRNRTSCIELIAHLQAGAQSVAEPVGQSAAEVGEIGVTRAEQERVPAGDERIQLCIPEVLEMVVPVSRERPHYRIAEVLPCPQRADLGARSDSFPEHGFASN